MIEGELRPLSLGELLDRSFSLYRNHFSLFVGISAFPHVLSMTVAVAQDLAVVFPQLRDRAIGHEPRIAPGTGALVALGVFVVTSCLVYLFAQSGTSYAVFDLYRGRPASVSSALQRTFAHVIRLAGSTVLNAIVLIAGFIFLTVPGVVLATRLIVALPAASIEGLGPTQAFARSYRLTRDFSGWSYLIYLLYLVLRLCTFALLLYPQHLANVLARHDFARGSLAILGWQFAAFAAATVIGPILWIAATVFYFDLRVKKEALDLQWMMSPEAPASMKSL
jgi:hypothetical protein